MAKSKPITGTTRKTLQDKASRSRFSYSTLAKVYRRGQGAFLGAGSRPGQTMQSWAMGRVNSFLRGSRKHDLDLRRKRK